MTKEEYRDFLKNEIAELTDLLKNGRGEPISLALLICEKNRLVDSLFWLDQNYEVPNQKES